MQPYLEDRINGGGEPIRVEVIEEDGRLCIIMQSLSKRNRVELALHIDRDVIHQEKQNDS